jgi:DNA-binding SARP family transcriptional activator
MPRSFRFEPPEPRPGTLTRPRLLRTLLRRWEHRVTVIVGGPGLGKTTLLGQALAENRMAPRGVDVWIGVEPADADGETLARDVAWAVDARSGVPPPEEPTTGDGRPTGGAPRPTSDPGAVSDAVWRRAPTPVCLVFDDIHLVPPGSPGATWLSDLADALPANGHLVFASRAAPPIPLARPGTPGSAVVEVTEDDLRFTGDELAGFAGARGVEAEELADAAGWPAMAELAASVDRDRAGEYLWEEVLEPLGSERRRILAVVTDLGGADDALASAVLGADVHVAGALADVPLVARGADGWCAPHALWKSASGLALPPAERAALRRRAAAHLVDRGRFDDAFALVSDVDEWDSAAEVLRAACLSGERPAAGKLDRWLDALPAECLEAPAGRLARGLRAAVASPRHAADPLRDAAHACREAGDADGELAALALLGRVGWWIQDVSILAEIVPRVVELAAEGHPEARALAALARAVGSDLAGDDEGVLAALTDIEPGALDASWRAVADWLRAAVLISVGEAAEALEVLDGISGVVDVAFVRTIESLRLVAWWALGRVDAVLDALPRLLDGVRAAGQAQNIMLALSNASFAQSLAGEIDLARRNLDEAGSHEARTGAPSVSLALARAALAVAEGDESSAARLIDDAVTSVGLERGSDRRAWRHALSLSYVLVPDTRPDWDEVSLRGHLSSARALARAVVDVRGGGLRNLRRLDVPPPDTVRALLHHRFAAELAVGLQGAGRPEGAALLDVLGPAGRATARAIAAGGTSLAAPARALLSAVPAPPPRAIELAVLGPLALRRGGAPVTGGDLRRERVRALLAFLVLHRKTTREAAIDALWPELDERSGGNNLRVTLTYLLRVLEPDRPPGEPAYTLRFDRQELRLLTGDFLQLDVDRFDMHVLAAARAESGGSPSVALDHLLAAVDLYRGELHAGVDADWLTLDRAHYEQRFVDAATRAAQLVAGHGQHDRAEALARSAIDVDPWAEHAHAVLVAAALARGDRAAARAALQRCEAALSELGVEPSDETRRLARHVGGGRSAAG